MEIASSIVRTEMFSSRVVSLRLRKIIKIERGREMKKLGIIVSIALVLLVALVGCKDEPAHNHSYGEGKVTTLATSEHEGVITYTCSCGATKTEKIPALGHALESKNTKTSYEEAYKKLVQKLGFFSNEKTSQKAETDAQYAMFKVFDDVLKSNLSLKDGSFKAEGSADANTKTLTAKLTFENYLYNKEKISGSIGIEVDVSKMEENSETSPVSFKFDNFAYGTKKIESEEDLYNLNPSDLYGFLYDLGGKLLKQGVLVDGEFCRIDVRFDTFEAKEFSTAISPYWVPTELEGDVSFELVSPALIDGDSYKGKVSASIDVAVSYEVLSKATGEEAHIVISTIEGSFSADCDLETAGNIGVHEICFGIKNEQIDKKGYNDSLDFLDGTWKLAMRIDGDMVSIPELYAELKKDLANSENPEQGE